MFKIISKTPVVPQSFIVTGVSISDKRDYIGRGGYGNVFKGDFRGTVGALKVLYKNDANGLVSFHFLFLGRCFILLPTGVLSRSIDVGIP